MADKAVGVHLEDYRIVQGVRTGNSPWSPIAIAQVPVKEAAPSAPTIESVTAPEASAGVLEIKVGLPETNADGTALARAELVRLRLHHSTSPGVDESDPYVDFPPSETLLWAPNDTVTHYVRVRVQDSHGLWSELSNEASGQAHASTPQEDSGLWAHRLGVESIFTNDSPDPGYVSWSNVVLYWKDNKYEIEDGSTNKKYIWWDYLTSTTTFQTSDTRPELDLEDVIVGYNDNGTWRLMCYQPTVMADYVRAGVLQSSNWGATTGSQFNLDDGTFKLGGSDSPALSWDGSALSIRGYLAGETLDDVPDGATYGRVLKTDISAGHIILSACEGDLDDIADGATYKKTTAEEKEGASRAYSGLDSSGRLVTAVLPSTPVSTPGASGLYLGSDYLGYFDGSTWKTYMDNAGKFYLDGTNGYLHWDPNTDNLSIKGSVTITGGNLVGLGFGTGDNLLYNPGFEQGADFWGDNGELQTSGGSDSDNWWKITRSGTNQVDVAKDFDGATRYIEVNPGETYEIKADLKSDGSCTARVNVQVLKADKSTSLGFYGNISSISTTWESKSAQFQIPAEGKFLKFRLIARDADGWAGFDNLSLRRIDVGGIVPSNWAYSGDTTYIDGGKIYTGTITANQITTEEAVITETAQIADAIITSAKISDLTFDKITAGTNTASLTIGSGGYIQSENYSAGSSGFRISGSGSAEFNDVTIRDAVVTGGTITAADFQTASSGQSVRIGATGTDPHNVRCIGTGGDVGAAMYTSGTDGVIYVGCNYTHYIEMKGVNTGLSDAYGKLDFYTPSLGEIVIKLDGSDGSITCKKIYGAFQYSGSQVFSGSAPTSWTDLDLSSYVGSRRALVFLKVKNSGGFGQQYEFRMNGDTDNYSYGADWPQCSACTVASGECGTVWAETDASGVLEWKTNNGYSTTVWLLAYIT